ncbi:MAG: hypothetical protein QMC36_01410 [Patescibacteria group bacterium]
MKRFLPLALVVGAISGCAVNVRPSARPEPLAYEAAEPAPAYRPNDQERIEKRRKIRALLREIRGERQ